jgi:hypothetical protein
MNFPSRKVLSHPQALSFGALLVCLMAATSSASLAQRPPQGPNEDGTDAALVRIAGEGMVESHAFQYLTELSDDIGPRVTGSPSSQRAIDWGEDARYRP